MQSAVFSKPLLTAFAGVSLSISSAFAATVPAPASGDIFLGFRASGGAGADVSYLINIGQASQFTGAAPGSSFTVNTGGNIAIDLATAYDNWATRNDFFWGVFGATNTTSPTVYGTRQRADVNTPSAPWPSLELGERTATKSQILSPISGPSGSYVLLQASANSPVAAFQANSAESSYYKQVGEGLSDFGSQSYWTSIEGSFINGASGTVLDFYRIRNAAPQVTNLGKFTISPAGIITFTAASSTPPANTDTDGDGYTDALEAVAGTDPNNGADFFRVQTIQHAGTGNSVSFNTIPNRSYVVEYSETLLADSWIPVGVPYITTTSGGAVTIPDNDPVRTGKPRGFYRVKVSQ